MFITVFSFHMYSQIMPIACLVVTMIASILNTFMFRLNMIPQKLPISGLKVTLIAIILDTFMY